MKINYPAVVASAAAYWVLGALWYSPLLFARPFIALKGWTPEQLALIEAQGHAGEIGLAFLTSLLLAYVLAHFVKFTGAETAGSGALTGFWLWLGFVVTTNLETVIFEQRPLVFRPAALAVVVLDAEEYFRPVPFCETPYEQRVDDMANV